MTGYTYGEPEPNIPCPYCGTKCYADFCDIGVGYQQVGPYHCTECRASEVGAYEDTSTRPDYDPETGWYLPGSPAGETANVDDDGNIINHVEATRLYREKHGETLR